MSPSFVDLHCHLLPGIDDGAKDLKTSLAMAQMAIDDGITTVIATPHQLGNFAHNRGADIRQAVDELQRQLQDRQIPLQVLAGADVRIEPEMVPLLERGEVLTLGDHGRHVLLELPHELYVPLEPVLEELNRVGMLGILSHPERNGGILRDPAVCRTLVERGCLLQVTAGSLLGAFGPDCRRLAEQLLGEGLVHFLASDAHGLRSRRPLLRAACQRAAELIGRPQAEEICCHNPRQVAAGQEVAAGRRAGRSVSARWMSNWFGRRKAS